MYKLFIFDFDGTVANSLETITYYVNMTLKQYNLKAFNQNKIRYFVGNGASLLIERVLKARDCYTEEFHKEFLDKYLKNYNSDAMYLTEPYEGILETLAQLKLKGIKLAILSNKPDSSVQLATASLFGKKLFDVALGQKDGYPVKPDATLGKTILEKFDVSPDECVYIGDTDVDMQTGKNLGAFTVGVTWGFRDIKELKDNGADLIINEPQELLNIL